MDPAIEEVMSSIAAQGIAPAGPVFSHHFRMDPRTFDFEVGVPVAERIEEMGRMKPGRLAAATAARTVYHGPYDGLAAAWGELDAWIEGEGHAPAPDLWERYLVAPDSTPDPSAWRTELNRPLIRAAGSEVSRKADGKAP